MVWHFEDSVTVWFGMCIGSTLLEECTDFVFRPKCGGNVSVWDIGTCPPNYISRRLRKIVKNSCYLSHVCRLPQNVMFEYFFGNLSRKRSFIGIWQEWWILHISMNVWFYLCQFFLDWEIFHKKLYRKPKHTFCIPPPKLCCLWNRVEKYCRARQTADYNMARAQCMLDY
jgi:hypothetical protein